MVASGLQTKWNWETSLIFGIRTMRQKPDNQGSSDQSGLSLITGFRYHDHIPHFSTFGKNYECHFQDCELIEEILTRHIWQKQLKEADLLRHTPEVRESYLKQKETIKRLFPMQKKSKKIATGHRRVQLKHRKIVKRSLYY